MSSSADLVIFTCEGKSHLLARTVSSFWDKCDFSFNKIILSVDGNVKYSVLKPFDYDLIVKSAKREGYVNNILNALRLIESDSFFWLEDDWIFKNKLEISSILSILNSKNKYSQIRLRRYTHGNGVKNGALIEETEAYFSANPSLCKTHVIKNAFESFMESTERDVSFEGYLSQWCKKHSLISPVYSPNNTTSVEHIGDLESTERKWHMKSSIDNSSNYVPRASVTQPTIPHKIYMVLKLCKKFAWLSVNQFIDDSVFDLSHRIAKAEPDR